MRPAAPAGSCALRLPAASAQLALAPVTVAPVWRAEGRATTLVRASLFSIQSHFARMPDGPVVAIIVLVVAGVLAALYFYIEHRRHAPAAERAQPRATERLPLFGTDMLATRGGDGALHAPDEDGAPQPPRIQARRHPPPPARPESFAAGAAAPRPANSNGWGPPPERVPLRPPAFDGTPHPAVRTPADSPLGAPLRTRTATLPAPDEHAFATGETLRFAIPDEGTLRFLPGRLEVVGGPDTGREVRFVAPPGSGDKVEITFGRTEGPAYRHVQLLARTVSRRHALMSLDDGHWNLTNLSATNPVLLNGRALAPDEVAPLLVDGDRIEMGEVVFLFHSR